MLTVTALALALVLAPSPRDARAAKPLPPPAVTVVPVRVRDVAPVRSYIGRVQAIQTVQVMARVSAFIDKVAFREGSMVKAGQLLFRLQQAPFQATFDAARAALAKARANALNAQDNYARVASMARRGVQSVATLNAATATRDADAANVQAARANVETAALNLSYTTITSPIAGRIGRAAYTRGNLVGSGSGVLATVVQVDPIRVVFSVTDRRLTHERRKLHLTQAAIDRALAVRLTLPDGSSYDEPGQIEFVNNVADPSTGTVTIWARFANPRGLLVPGEFVGVRLRRAKPKDRPVVPMAAVENGRHGKFVLVVDAHDKVAKRPVTVGRQHGQDWIVTGGLKAGERVIVAGLQKVKSGQIVRPHEHGGGGTVEASGR